MSSSGDGGVSKESVSKIIEHNRYENHGSSMKGMMYAFTQLGDLFNVSLFRKSVPAPTTPGPIFFLNSMSERLLVWNNYNLKDGVYIGQGKFERFSTDLPYQVSDAHYFYNGNYWNVFSVDKIGYMYDHLFNPFTGMKFSSRVLNWTGELSNEGMRHVNFFWINNTTVLYAFDNGHFNIFDMANWRNYHVFPESSASWCVDGEFVCGQGDVDGSGLNQFSITRCSYTRPSAMPLRNRHRVLEFAMGGRFFVSIRGCTVNSEMSVCVFFVDTSEWVFSEPFVVPGDLKPLDLFVSIEGDCKFKLYTPRFLDDDTPQEVDFFADVNIKDDAPIGVTVCRS